VWNGRACRLEHLSSSSIKRPLRVGASPPDRAWLLIHIWYTALSKRASRTFDRSFVWGLPTQGRNEYQGDSMSDDRTIFVTEQDLERFTRVLDARKSGRETDACAALEEELGRAHVVESEAIPPDVVTMNSRVRFQDVDSLDEMEVTLVYPQEADVNAGKISVLAPVGSALLGLSCGQSIEWPVPAGRTRRLRIVDVIYQPEAAGDLQL